MELRIVGAGLGRTGTLSLKTAIERLIGGHCYHMVEVFGHAEHAPIWEAAAHGNAVDWDAVLADYNATVDWPACALWRDRGREPGRDHPALDARQRADVVEEREPDDLRRHG